MFCGGVLFFLRLRQFVERTGSCKGNPRMKRAANRFAVCCFVFFFWVTANVITPDFETLGRAPGGFS